jgi:hypothetical protein
MHERPSDFQHLAPHTHWTAAAAGRLLHAQLRLGFLPPPSQLRALAAALLPQIEGRTTCGEALALLEALAICSFHPGEQVGAY